MSNFTNELHNNKGILSYWTVDIKEKDFACPNTSSQRLKQTLSTVEFCVELFVKETWKWVQRGNKEAVDLHKPSNL